MVVASAYGPCFWEFGAYGSSGKVMVLMADKTPLNVWNTFWITLLPNGSCLASWRALHVLRIGPPARVDDASMIQGENN